MLWKSGVEAFFRLPAISDHLNEKGTPGSSNRRAQGVKK
jgi:hypothetical protein